MKPWSDLTLAAFQRAQKRLKAGGLCAPDWICKTGAVTLPKDNLCVVFKLQKPAWTLDAATQTSGDIGLFFSLWMDERAAGSNRLLYNLHALKLRQLTPFKLESRRFADAFRRRFASNLADWRNVSLDHGPQTLMEGWVSSAPEHSEESAVELASRFASSVSPIVDSLLAPAPAKPSKISAPRSRT